MSRLFRQLRLRFRSLFRRRRVEQELNEELQYHLDRQIEEGLANGLTPKEARYAALRSLGAVAQNKEECRDVRRVSWIEDMVQDLRYSARTLRKSPGFSIVAILMLALGIGASTVIFSVVDAVLLRPLPYPNPQQIVRVWEQTPKGNRINLADQNFDDFRTQNTTFADLAVYNYRLQSVSGGNEPVRVKVAAVSKGFFKALGIEPLNGRNFAPDEQRLHGAPVAIVSYHYWQQYLSGSSDLSKFHLTMNGGVYSVIGVMPETFDFPHSVAIWIPSELYPKLHNRTAHNWQCLGRIREGMTLAQARANLSTIARRIKDQYGNDVHLNDAAVVPLSDAMVGEMRTALLTLLGAVGLLLVVACANVAGLLLARASARRKELAVRVALGAGRGRLVRHFLAESFVLSFAGSLLGILIAVWGIKILPLILPENLPRQENIVINISVLLFALAVTVAVAFSLGLFAAWRAGEGDLQEALIAGSRSHTGSNTSQRMRSFLVIGEIATTIVILIGAGLLGRSFLRLISTNPGFNPQNLITVEFSPPVSMGQTEQSSIVRQAGLMKEILTRLRTIPGVETVGLASGIPAAAGDNLPEGDFLILNGQKPPASSNEWASIAQNSSQVGHALYAVAGEEYMRTLGIALIRGRMFGEQDDWNSPHVAMISETLARQRWPNQDPVGQIIFFGNMDGELKPLTIIGIAGDVRARGLNRPPGAVIYVHYRQRGMKANSSPTIVMRSAAPMGEIVSAARGIFHDLAPDVPVKVSTFANEMGGWLADRRFLLLLVGLFAATALVLAAAGIYGIVAFSATRRIQEFGIRLAIGATEGDVLRLVLRQAAILIAAGVGLGLLGSAMLSRFIASLLYGVSSLDLLTFAAVSLLLSAVALVASYIPARRATKIDPLSALRYE